MNSGNYIYSPYDPFFPSPYTVNVTCSYSTKELAEAIKKALDEVGRDFINQSLSLLDQFRKTVGSLERVEILLGGNTTIPKLSTGLNSALPMNIAESSTSLNSTSKMISKINHPELQFNITINNIIIFLLLLPCSIFILWKAYSALRDFDKDMNTLENQIYAHRHGISALLGLFLCAAYWLFSEQKFAFKSQNHVFNFIFIILCIYTSIRMKNEAKQKNSLAYMKYSYIPLYLSIMLGANPYSFLFQKYLFAGPTLALSVAVPFFAFYSIYKFFNNPTRAMLFDVIGILVGFSLIIFLNISNNFILNLSDNLNKAIYFCYIIPLLSITYSCWRNYEEARYIHGSFGLISATIAFQVLFQSVYMQDFFVSALSLFIDNIYTIFLAIPLVGLLWGNNYIYESLSSNIRNVHNDSDVKSIIQKRHDIFLGIAKYTFFSYGTIMYTIELSTIHNLLITLFCCLAWRNFNNLEKELRKAIKGSLILSNPDKNATGAGAISLFGVVKNRDLYTYLYLVSSIGIGAMGIFASFSPDIKHGVLKFIIGLTFFASYGMQLIGATTGHGIDEASNSPSIKDRIDTRWAGFDSHSLLAIPDFVARFLLSCWDIFIATLDWSKNKSQNFITWISNKFAGVSLFINQKTDLFQPTDVKRFLGKYISSEAFLEEIKRRDNANFLFANSKLHDLFLLFVIGAAKFMYIVNRQFSDSSYLPSTVTGIKGIIFNIKGMFSFLINKNGLKNFIMHNLNPKNITAKSIYSMLSKVSNAFIVVFIAIQIGRVNATQSKYTKNQQEISLVLTVLFALSFSLVPYMGTLTSLIKNIAMKEVSLPLKLLSICLFVSYSAIKARSNFASVYQSISNEDERKHMLSEHSFLIFSTGLMLVSNILGLFVFDMEVNNIIVMNCAAHVILDLLHIANAVRLADPEYKTLDVKKRIQIGLIATSLSIVGGTCLAIASSAVAAPQAWANEMMAGVGYVIVTTSLMTHCLGLIKDSYEERIERERA